MSELSTAALVELESFHHAVPLPKAGVRWVADLDDTLLGPAVVVVPYAIANEHVGLHAVLVDRPLPDYSTPDAVATGLSRRPVALHRSDDVAGIRSSWSRGDAVFVATWDGRDPDGRRSTLRALVPVLGPLLDDPTRPPRLVVPGPADWSLLRDAFAWELPLRRSFHDPEIERFALATHWWIERAKVPGQLSVVVLSDVIHRSWQVPLESDDQLHLGATLACFGPAAGDRRALLVAVADAERRPAGPRSLPSFDNTVFLEALAATGRPPDAAAWQTAVELLWDHVAHRRADVHRAVRIVYADPDLPAAPSIAPTGTKTRPGLVEVERTEWGGHLGRRDEVEADYAAYDEVFRRLGPDDPATDAARRAATSTRNRRLPRHHWPSRFRDATRLGDALELRVVLEDPFARAEARRRGIALPGSVIDAPAPVVGGAVLRSGKWERVYTYTFTLQVAGSRSLGRYRQGKDVSFGPFGFAGVGSVLGEGVVRSVDHSSRTLEVAYTRKATSARGPDAVRQPAPYVVAGNQVEVLPSCKYAHLGDDFMPVGPSPRTHHRPRGGGVVVLAAATVPHHPLPADLR